MQSAGDVVHRFGADREAMGKLPGSECGIEREHGERHEERSEMQMRTAWTAAVAVVLGCAFGFVGSAAAGSLGTGKHFTLNIVGFSKCTMTADGVYPDCFKGNDQPGGHVIKVPLKTSQTENICATSPITDPANVTVAQL